MVGNQTELGIISARDAAFVVAKLLRDIGFEIGKHKTHFNTNGNHFELVNQRSGKIYHIKFAREFFLSFGKIFRQYDGEVGDTLDEIILKDLKDNDELIFAYPTMIYCISVEKFREFALSRTNDRDKDVKTLSIPISKLERFY